MIAFKLLVLKQTIKKSGLNPIFLRLTKKSKVRYLYTGIDCLLKDWLESKEAIRKNSELNIKNNLIISGFKTLKLEKFEKLSQERKENIELDEFVELLKPKERNLVATNFFELIEDKIKTLKEVNNYGYAKYFSDTRNSILTFQKNKRNLEIESINVAWLKEYEHFLRKNECVDSGIAVRMRAIRIIFNVAMENEIITIDKYPFRVYKIAKLKGNKKIRSIPINELKLIENLDTDLYPNLKLSKDLFLFSYYSNGMNFVDMMHLQYSNLYDNNTRLFYQRRKTKGNFDFELLGPAKEIIEYYQKHKINTSYIFPILLSDNLTALQISYRRHKTIGKFNKDLKEIGRICEIDFDLTSYVARHSMASTLQNKGVAVDTISEIMGHQSSKVTKGYLKRLGNEVIDNAMKNLIN